ncbi:MAG: NUDIX hydrolase [Planctomycetes bacterium]|nr:NUDIX hydrolase [Planctomycetota bacterium]
MPAGSTHSETTHSGRLLTVEVRSFTDDDGRAVVREIVHHPGAVVIVPVLDDDRVVLIRNHRIAVDEVLWELPAGTMEPGEEPAATAARELTEETGYAARHVTALTQFYTSPGFCDELLHVFVAEDLSFVGQDLDAGETIEVVELPRDETLAMIDDGRIRDGKTIAGLLQWQRVREARAGGAAP